MAQYVRFEQGGHIGYGIKTGEVINVLNANFLEGGQMTGEKFQLSDVKLLAPVTPPNIIGIGLNYMPHIQETKMKLPKQPLLFLKSTTSVTGPDTQIVLPKIAPEKVDYEGELVIIIRKTAKNITEEDADQYILGYSIANDISARDCQIRIDTQWCRGKSFDTFCPFGPVIETEIDPDHLHIITRLNGVTMQDSTTEMMIFSPRSLVSYISRNMTLLPGTIILSGTPAGVGFKRIPPVYLKAGDNIEVEIEKIGILRNTVVEE